MRPLNGIHHISAITADATQNLAFYVGVMGLRLVKKTVNQDNPTVYHLFYADEEGSPGADLTFFEYPGLVRGRAGARQATSSCTRRLASCTARTAPTSRAESRADPSTRRMRRPISAGSAAREPSTTSRGLRPWTTTSAGAVA